MSTSGGAPTAGAILGGVQYGPSGNNTYTTSSNSLVAIDSTNIAVPITVPASGSYWVEIESTNAAGTTNDPIVFGAMVGASQVGAVGETNPTSVFYRTPYRTLVTGRTPGASETVLGAWLVTAGVATIA